MPIIGNVLKRIFKGFRNKNSYPFERQSFDDNFKEDEKTLVQIKNLVNYTKTSGSSYNAQIYPGGYHTIKFKKNVLKGQREPEERFKPLKFGFSGKKVLDIGTNQGGMLFNIQDKIKWGVGIDYDKNMINAANRIKRINDFDNLDFYVFDLDHEPYDLLFDLLPESKVDIVFLLAVCMWVKNWKNLIKFSSQISNNMLFESNGSKEEQKEQIEVLKSVFEKVEVLKENSDDDPKQKNRKLLFCEK